MTSVLLLSLLLSDPASAARRWATTRIMDDALGWDAGAKALSTPGVAMVEAMQARRTTYQWADARAIGPLIAPILATANLREGDEPNAAQRASIAGGMRGIAREERAIVAQMEGHSWTWMASIGAVLALFAIVAAGMVGWAIRRGEGPSTPEGFGFDVASRAELDARLLPLSAQIEVRDERLAAIESMLVGIKPLDFAGLKVEVDALKLKVEEKVVDAQWYRDRQAELAGRIARIEDETIDRIKRDLGELAKIVEGLQEGFKAIEAERLSAEDCDEISAALTVLAEYYGGKPGAPDLTRVPA